MDLTNVLGIGVLVATFLGPVLAVWVSAHNDERRQLRHRRLEIFRMLMKNRAAPLAYEFVAALNLIEVEFYGETAVISHWRSLLSHFTEMAKKRPEHKTEDELKFENKKSIDLTNALLFEMSKSVKMSIPESIIRDGIYFPGGWGRQQEEDKTIKGFLVNIAHGQAALPIMVYQPPNPAAGIAKTLAERKP